MKIRKATPTDLDILLLLYDNARRFMAAHGNPTQWGTAYPPRTLLESDIAEGCSYVCEEQQKVIAAKRTPTAASAMGSGWMSPLTASSTASHRTAPSGAPVPSVSTGHSRSAET